MSYTATSSTDGKYRVGQNQVAFTQIGAVKVSTIWWKRTEPGGDWFETLVSGSQIPKIFGSQADALRGHAAAVSELIEKLTAQLATEDPK